MQRLGIITLHVTSVRGPTNREGTTYSAEINCRDRTIAHGPPYRKVGGRCQTNVARDLPTQICCHFCTQVCLQREKNGGDCTIAHGLPYRKLGGRCQTNVARGLPTQICYSFRTACSAKKTAAIARSRADERIDWVADALPATICYWFYILRSEENEKTKHINPGSCATSRNSIHFCAVRNRAMFRALFQICSA